MSRIGLMPITIPDDVKPEIANNLVKVSGPKGMLEVKLSQAVNIELKNKQLIVSLKKSHWLGESLARRGRLEVKSLHGLTRALLQNAITGVTMGWQKTLELVGVGFRAEGGGKEMTLQVGFSHPVKIIAPAGIEFKIKDNTRIEVSGIDKNAVGEVAAKVRSVKPPEPYKGKGIRYQGEYIRKKAGKAVKTVTAG